MLVSVAIFSIVMVMALGALLALSSADRRAEALKSGIDNLTFALDSMSRSIRTGSLYHCGSGGVATVPQDCSTTGANYLTFLASNGVQTYYQLDTDQTSGSLCGQTTLPYGCIERKLGASGTWIPVTSPDVAIQPNAGFLFHVRGSVAGDGIQPIVTITASSTVQISATQHTGVFMQTSVTQRIYDQ